MAGERPWQAMPLTAMQAAWAASPTLVVVTEGPEHRLAYQNPASAGLFGDRPIGRTVDEAFPELSAEGRAALDQVMATGVTVVQPSTTPGVRGLAGDEVLLTYVFAPLGPPGEPPGGVLLTAIDMTAEALAERAAEQVALLDRLSAGMNEAAGPRPALQHLTDTLVPRIADIAAVFVISDPESRPMAPWGAAASSPRPPNLPSAVTIDPDLLARAGPPPTNRQDTQPSPWEESLASGRSLLIDIEGGELDERSDAASRAWFAAAAVRNMAVLPLSMAGQLAGAVVLLSAGPRAPYGPEDLPFLEQVAARAGTAVSHVRAFRHNREIALDLQHALLPVAPADLPRAKAAVRYVAGGPDVEIGGDWWDVHALGPTRTGIGLGDVAGRGVPAAIVMGQARSAMRTAALADLPPAAVLTLLDLQLADLFDATVRTELPSAPRFATAVYAVLDSADQTLRVANAGHPPLLVREPGAAAHWLQARPGPPLGLRLPAYEELVVPFPTGSLLLGFTDGLVESRVDGLDGGLRRLAAYVDQLPETEDVELIADGALECMSGYVPLDDDIALVVLRSTG